MNKNTELADRKDVKRIRDMLDKSSNAAGVDTAKLTQYALNMANAIGSTDKALRRATACKMVATASNATEKTSLKAVEQIFLNRAKQLGW